MCALLAANGHVVVGQSEEPTCAVADIRQLLPDVLLLDLRLGMRSGFEVLAELQRRRIQIRTVVTTMSNQAQDVAEALRYGVDAYILKGSTGAELMQAIDAVLRGERHYEGPAAKLALQALSTRDGVSALASLSTRERQVIVMVVNGHSSIEIGTELHLSPKTVDSYRSRLMAKVGVRDVPGLVRFALRTGLIAVEDL